MYVLPELPYAHDALEPTVSADTLRTHHGKHHKAYVDKTNELAAKAGLTGRPLEAVVREARRLGDQKLFNNAGQAWNHAFFWHCMTPDQQPPSGELAAAIEQAFGGLAGLKEAFLAEGVNHFASGWAWLVAGPDGLKVTSYHDADTPIVHEDGVPLLVCDVWEHAYYLDYKNDRKGFLDRWFDQAANWAFAEAQFAAANGRGDIFRYPEPERDAAPGDAGETPIAPR